MNKFWLTITNIKNWEIIKSYGIYAVKSKNQYNQLSEGDKLAIYLLPKKICALYKIKSIKSKQNKKFSNRDFKYYFDIEPLLILKEPLEVNNKIVDNLSIFKRAIRWGTVLMGRSMIEITTTDYRYLEKEIKNASV